MKSGGAHVRERERYVYRYCIKFIIYAPMIWAGRAKREKKVKREREREREIEVQIHTFAKV